MAHFADSNVVDAGQKSVKLVFSIPTDGMVVGDERSMHLSPDHLRMAANVKHLDLLNPTEITTHIESTAGKLGVTLHHNQERDVKLSTPTRVLYVNGDTNEAEAFHAIGTHSVIPEVHTLQLTPEAHQTKVNHAILLKRNTPAWEKFQPSNVESGTYLSTLGDETRVLITEEDENGNKNAVHALLKNNETNSNLLGGRYLAKNQTHTKVAGRDAIVMEQDDFNNIKDSLVASLTPQSNWNKGLNVTTRKLSGEKAKPGSMAYVHVNITRSPMKPDTGIQEVQDTAVTDRHVVSLTGGKLEPEASNSRPGFENESGDLGAHSQATVVPYKLEKSSNNGGSD